MYTYLLVYLFLYHLSSDEVALAVQQQRWDLPELAAEGQRKRGGGGGGGGESASFDAKENWFLNMLPLHQTAFARFCSALPFDWMIRARCGR